MILRLERKDGSQKYVKWHEGPPLFYEVVFLGFRGFCGQSEDAISPITKKICYTRIPPQFQGQDSNEVVYVEE